MAKLDTYRRKRDFDRTPEPAGSRRGTGKAKAPRFVVQEHHARRLHWDLRLERDGVLVSWAVPKGLPLDPATNHLAVHTEDHPMEYLDFHGEIPAGEYGGGNMTIWDRGTYEVEKWTDREVKVVLHGERVSGRYVLFHTRDRDWMVHRMDPPPDPDWTPLPEALVPMLATSGKGLPRDDDRWAYELKWDGVRALAYVEGGRVRLQSRNLLDVTGSYPEVREMGEALGSRQVLLDGEVCAFDPEGRPRFGLLQQRIHLTGEVARRRRLERPVVYVVFDVLHLDGHDVTQLPYEERRRLVDGLGLSGPAWQVSPWFRGDGAAVLEASRERGFEGVLAKRLDSPYLPGRRSDTWRKVKNSSRQEMVVGGWTRGEGNREGYLGALLLGYYDDTATLRFAGHVGTGFTTRTLRDLRDRLAPIERQDSPFADPLPGVLRRRSTFVEPVLVAEVEFTEWTSDGKLRHPSYKGLRTDKDARDVIREPA